MIFPKKLQEGIFLKRYKRFFADIEFQGRQLLAHVANTGSLKSINNPGRDCLFSESTNPERKLKFSLEMIKAPSGAWVGVNTSIPNAVIKEILQRVIGKKEIGPYELWSQFDEVMPEYKINAKTRLDFALKKNDQDKFHFIEVKNVTLAENNIAKFPDAVSERGQKHIRELVQMIDQGHSAELVFFIQRNDCETFAPADDIDPVYGQLLRDAILKGLKVSPYVANLTAESVELSDNILPLKI